ncbi:MAG: MFS transporter [Candidatus Bathyarchaeia archaeon]
MSSFRVIRDTFSSRNLAVLTFTQTLFMFTAFLWWPYWSLFILKLGATKEQLGMLLMIETVTQIASQLTGGVLADRLGRRRVIVYGSILRGVSFLVYLLATYWIHLAPGLFLGSAAMLSLPAINALIAESLSPETRSSGFAAYRTVTWMPMIITSLLGGVLMDYYGVIRGVRLCMLASLVVAIASTILRWRFIQETLESVRLKEDETSKGLKAVGGFLRGLGRMPRQVWVLTGVAALGGFSMRIVRAFMVIYAVEVVGLTKTQWGVIGTVVSIISTALTFPGGRLADRIGKKPCITLSRIFSPLSTIGFTFASNFWQLGFVRALGGVAQGFGGVVWGPVGGPVWQALVADLTPMEDRGRLMGLMGSIAGIVSTPASWVGGYMYDNISPALPFRTSFVLDIIGTMIFVALLKEPEKSE